MIKRRTPLQVIMADVKCTSLANGWIRVVPRYRDLKPGIFDRMWTARQLEKLIRRELKR